MEDSSRFSRVFRGVRPDYCNITKGGSLKFIMILHWEGVGGGGSQDPKFVLPDLWTAPNSNVLFNWLSCCRLQNQGADVLKTLTVDSKFKRNIFTAETFVKSRWQLVLSFKRLCYPLTTNLCCSKL